MTPYTLPEPSCTYADHSYPAFTKAQMQAAFAAGAASRDADIAQLNQDYSAKCAELEIVHAAHDAEIEALRKKLYESKTCQCGYDDVCEFAREADRLRADAAFAIDMLAMMFDKYENGVTCYEDPAECSGALGNAISIENGDFHAIADFLNKHRPIAAIAAEATK